MKIKILKKENEVSKVEIDGREYKNISKVEIKNDYTSNGINESVIIEFKDISLLEISTEKWGNKKTLRLVLRQIAIRSLLTAPLIRWVPLL